MKNIIKRLKKMLKWLYEVTFTGRSWVNDYDVDVPDWYVASGDPCDPPTTTDFIADPNKNKR